MDELDQLGLVEPKRFPEDGKVAGGGVLAQNENGHVAGEHPHQEKGDEHHDEKHGDGGEDALDGVF